MLIEILALLGLAGVMDYYSGYQVSMSIFYGVPIFMTAWFLTKKDAILIALIAGLIWWWADVRAGHPYLHNWQEGWETLVRLGYFIFIAIGAASLREQRDVAAARIELLEHSQKLEREIVEISEREQGRIGRDLHDGLCQYLAALGCAAASLGSDLEKQELRKEANVANDLAKFLQDAVVQARDLARGLMPMQMDEAALTIALENLAASVSRLQRVECKFEADGTPTHFDKTSAMHLYRIAQEAINNATRHGKAQKIDISLRANADKTELLITDNGIGLSQSTRSRSGMGLNIMTYRARLSGGELKVGERSAGGTSVSCTIEAPVERST